MKKKLVTVRLKTLPANIGFCVSGHNLNRDELIEEVQKESNIGKLIVDMELEFIRKMPHLAEQIISARK